MNIVISNQSGVPIYEQIKEQIKASVLAGVLVENDPLPSLRQLARDLQVSLITTTRAYSELELEGFVRTMPGKGVYVKKINDAFVRDRYRKEAEDALTAAVRHGKLAGLSPDDLHTMLDTIERTIK
ncbi:HTH-type transcriptional repressor YtrA [Eubacterium plexicaudatum ASF492]|uniref:HTH gntR-type domain-containing protein n=1 Tax=Eubacterium plexicaudatum ASF492 TaxID=1235802 RepID=N2B9Z2_9FIRM|nr:HTH-type transcriptional repressor YtrA [Eubacterium plexicaudatum ASF492]KAI4446749.1 HTH-type transcriptional repressor YtrA [Eubacterium plexicaudatum ASF492]